MRNWLTLSAVLVACGVLDAQTEIDYGRTCLALAEYSEARSEGPTGMQAVALTVMNRLDDPAYPKSICEVVNDPGQYLGVQEWPYPRRPTEVDAWKDALAIADDAIAGRLAVASACAGATSFDQAARPPVGLVEVCQIGQLHFYTISNRGAYVAK